MGLKFLGFSVNGHFARLISLISVHDQEEKCYNGGKGEALTQVAAFHSQGTERYQNRLKEKSPKRKVSRSLRSREKGDYNGVWDGSGGKMPLNQIK